MRRDLTVISAVLLALAFPTALALVGLAGCATEIRGVPRPLAPDAYQSITNAVILATQSAAAVLPNPWSKLPELFAACVLAALTGYQALTYRQVKRLANGGNPTPNKQHQ